MSSVQVKGNTPLPGKPAEPLSGEVLGAMINLSGRRRWTSQRIVLYAVLASLNNEAALKTARDALKLFSEAHFALIKGNSVVPGVFSEALRSAYFGDMQGDDHICKFIDLAQRTLDAISGKPGSVAALLAQLVANNTALLDTVNHLTGLYEDEAKSHAARARKQLLDVMDDIKAIAKHARLVSMNAQIVAARAGDAGREFTVVARELSNITSEIDDLVILAMRDAVL